MRGERHSWQGTLRVYYTSAFLTVRNKWPLGFAKHEQVHHLDLKLFSNYLGIYLGVWVCQKASSVGSWQCLHLHDLDPQSTYHPSNIIYEHYQELKEINGPIYSESFLPYSIQPGPNLGIRG